MKFRAAGSVAMILSVSVLAGCGGGGDDEGGGDVILSSGLIDNVELPTDAERAAFPAEVQSVIAQFEAANQLAEATPSGNATYTGVSAFGVTDLSTDETVAAISGDAELNVDLGNPTVQVTGTFGNFSVVDIAEGRTVVVSSGSIDMANGVLSSNQFEGAATGSIDVTIDGQPASFAVSGNVEGAFGGTDANTGIGLINGTITGPDGDDGLEGLFVTTKN